MNIAELRTEYHRRICNDIIWLRESSKGDMSPNFADSASHSSKQIANHILKQFKFSISKKEVKEQTAGDLFEAYTKDFLEESFKLLLHLRPGNWVYTTEHTEISRYDQYEHLASVCELIKQDKRLSAALGRDYIVKPDIIVARTSINKDEINAKNDLLDSDSSVAKLSPLINENNKTRPHFLLHASISCKWTIRSDRSQNTRTEALNLIRNRKGHLPHIVAVTAEPLPTRIAALAIGTGDLDCVYHFALNELLEAVEEINNEDQKEMLTTMIDGRRLRDISDLPFDLIV